MGALNTTVHVKDPNGGFAAFGPGDEVPEWAARQMGAHCFEDGVHPYADEPEADEAVGESEPENERPTVEIPAKAGPKASKDAWVDYANSLGVDVAGCGTRDEVIAAVADAGHPVE